jgi:tight adherence protein B
VTLLAAISPRAAPLLAFVGAGLVGLAGMWLFIASAARQGTIADRGAIDIGPPRGPMQRLDAWIVRNRHGAALAGRLQSAGIEMSVGRFLLMRVAITLVVLLVADLLVPLALALACAVAAWWAVRFRVQRRLDRRSLEFVGQLPELARLLSNGASAGLSVPAALDLAAREIDDPARAELRTVIDELTYGRSVEDALETLAARLPSREIAVLLNCIIIQQRSGGDTVHALRELSHTLDTRRETSREVRTLMSGAVYTSYVVPFLGLASLLLLNTVNHKTLTRLTTSALGIIVLVICVVIYGIAFLAIRRVTRIEV